MTDQCIAAIVGFFNPKVFFDFLTHKMNIAVSPAPVLQVLNLLLGLLVLAWEWPLRCVQGSTIHYSIIARFFVFPMVALLAIFLYQATNAAIYYMIGVAVYIWAYLENEVCDLLLLFNS